MDKFGVFINYRHEDYFFALRVYDYLKYRGLNPFIDYDLHQGQFEDRLYNQIREAPYFLMVLTSRSCVDVREDDVYCKEIQTALDSGRTFLMVAEEGFDSADFDKLPFSDKEQIRILEGYQRCSIDKRMDNFYTKMNELCTKDIDLKELWEAISWREYARCNANVLLASRGELENDGVASLSNRFGADLVSYIENNYGQFPFEGECRIKHINMARYAASIIFAPGKEMVDYLAYDHGKMFNIISTLFHDPDFSMTLITNSPDSAAATDAVGRSSLATVHSMTIPGRYS
ncbi:MAG: toll/interleukin-1 receptor domain-containing protein [Coriobacteriaceae bacterium]|nr:toll/interleukin-1 receptor domain-containing protein [Coriobacteriaceae bacterium]